MRLLKVYGIIAGIFVLLIATVVILVSKTEEPIDIEYTPAFQQNDTDQWISGDVGAKTMRSTIKTVGEVEFVEDSLSVKSISLGDADEFEINIDTREEFVPNTVVYTVNDDDFSLDTYGRLIGVERSDNSVTIEYLDYDNQIISAFVSVEDESDIEYGQTVEVLFDDETISATIESIGYIAQNNKVEVTLDCEEGFLIGTRLDVVFVIDIFEPNTVIHEQFLHSDHEGPYVYLGNTQEKIRISTGATEGKYVEIISDQIAQGDKVYRRMGSYDG